MNDMENKNASTTTNDGLKEIDKQTNPVMYGWTGIGGYSISLNLKRHGSGMVIRLMRPMIE